MCFAMFYGKYTFFLHLTFSFGFQSVFCVKFYALLGQVCQSGEYLLVNWYDDLYLNIYQIFCTPAVHYLPFLIEGYVRRSYEG